jgi:hypothetical protein
MNFNTTRGIVKQGEALEVRIGPLIKDCATFSSHTVPTVAGHLRFQFNILHFLLTTR